MKSESKRKDLVYYTNILAVDYFDVAIKKVSGDKTGDFARVEFVGFQNKGTNRTEAVMAAGIRMYQLRELYEELGKVIQAFYDKPTDSGKS